MVVVTAPIIIIEPHHPTQNEACISSFAENRENSAAEHALPCIVRLASTLLDLLYLDNNDSDDFLDP